jgi:hypothetical protein
MTPEPNRRGRLVAIVTGAISIMVGGLYLGLILVLDSRGPLQPPPPEALLSSEGGAAAGVPFSAAVPPPV